MEKTGLALKNFLRMKASPTKNFFISTPKEILRSNNLPLKGTARGGGGGADIKCNSPI